MRKNHRYIGMINTAENVPASQLREKDFRQALADYGIAVEDVLIAYGEDGAKTLFSHYNNMTALFCFNDRVAMDVYDALR